MKKKLFLPILVVCLSIVLLTCSLDNVKVASAAPANILSDGFESGNLNAWESYYGSSSTFFIESQTVNSGVYSVESINFGQTPGNLDNQSLSGALPNPIDFREYVYVNSTSVPS